MDFIAHFLWTYIFFEDSSFLAGALVFSVAPDLLSWGIWSFFVLFNSRKIDVRNKKLIPDWVHALYGITHSIFIFSFVFLIMLLLTNHFPFYLLGWMLHILIDIPLHSREFLPTPFLWPLSDWKFPGISWGNKYFMMVNYTAIIILLFLVR
jgi:hypothetical protein